MKIAIVGNGKISRKYGKNINKCDLVIRFNQARIRGFEEYVGKKTDILALVGETSLSWPRAASGIDGDILANCEYILFAGRKRNKEYENAILKRKGSGNILFTYVGFEYFIEICKEINPKFEFTQNPPTGIAILCYILKTNNILESDENKLYVYGFDNFQTVHYFDNDKRNNDVIHDMDMSAHILEYIKPYKNVFIKN